MRWIGLDWIGSSKIWDGLDWIGLAFQKIWDGLDWIGLGFRKNGLDWIGISQSMPITDVSLSDPLFVGQPAGEV